MPALQTVGLGAADVVELEVDGEVVVTLVVEVEVVGGGVVVGLDVEVDVVVVDVGDDVGLVVGVDVVVVTVVDVAVVVGTPRDGVALQVVTCRPAVNEARPSGPSGSEGSSGTVPTYGLKL